MPTRVQVIHEARVVEPDGRALCFQWCRYVHEGGEMDVGYRFIWRRADGSLLPARGQARIPSMAVVMELVQMASDEGWGDLDAEAGVEVAERSVRRGFRPEDVEDELVADVRARTGIEDEAEIRRFAAVYLTCRQMGVIR